ncbi:hypothetical protein ACFP9V_18450 [Deinococcus radiopugnans]|uniref:Uncharacterized protein n=1 Tax=Deinococcus radiopugnans ATCC 19172 TaxID=585398 RepID=A0A5C4Y802_9DEIO|nr:hypothetical protein [Deinococcus radiopugnans]MBB6017461.1 hypothetical protein [Deinococcus radiopugnans ATCC 19172]TNM71987.1 hypothetical protein FHR04_06390 [Deinococcus radiopugnans ATCC 19172]
MRITGTDLVTWAGTVEASHKLPELVRRLILATSSAGISMRAGEGTRLGGFDGAVVQPESHSFIPEGASIWEMGVTADRRVKAEGDYASRTANPLTVVPINTTFVFVTPRRWEDKDIWAEEKRAEGIWQDVRVIDADDLEAWLSIAPPVEGWLAPLLGRPSNGIRSAERFWKDWSGVTNPPLVPQIVLAGWNNDPTLALRKILQGPPTAVGVAGESREVAAAFIAAALVAWGEESESLRARTLFVDDDRVWTSAVDHGRASILIPRFEQREQVSAAVRQGHHILIPLGRKDGALRAQIHLDRQQRRELRAALTDLQLPGERAEALATIGRRSLLSLRRRLAYVPAVHRPAWAQAGATVALIAPTLAGAWNGDEPGDQDVLARLAGRAYADVERDVVRLATEDDPPLRRVGRTWMLTSKEDAWALLVPTLTEDDIERFRTTTLAVLGTLDPALALSQEQRPLASFLGKTMPYSGFLREELADSLTLMAARSDETNWHLARTPQGVVNDIVRQLLAPQDSAAWASMAWVLPNLAEAAPEVFLEAVERQLHEGGDASVLHDLFQDKQNQIFGPSSPHTALLWALELLAWSPVYLTRSALALARLARIDPGGRLTNRPQASLREIFVAWSRNTGADAENKLRALDALRHQTPEVAWPLMLSLLPVGSDHSTPTHRPNWRDWGQDDDREVPLEERQTLWQGVVERLLDDVQNDGQRALNLLEVHGYLDEQQQDRLNAQLLHAVELLDHAAAMRVWEGLRHFVAKQQEYPDAGWAMEGTRLQRLQALADQLRPADPVLRHRWLFGHAPMLGVLWEPEEYGAREEALDQTRIGALTEILTGQGLPGIERLLDMLDKSDVAFAVGHVLARIPDAPLDDPDVLVALIQRGETGLLLVLGVVRTWLSTRGREHTETFLKSSGLFAGPDQQSAQLLLVLPTDERTWALVAQQKAEVEQLYWQQVQPYAVDRQAAGHVRTAFNQFLVHARPGAAFDLAEATPLSLTGEEWISLLLRMVAEGNEAIQNRSYQILKVLERLSDQSDVDEVALSQLTWLYLPLYHFRSAPRALTRVLLSNPAEYADMVARAYPKEEADEESDTRDGQRQAERERAFGLLQSLRGIPGSTEDGQIDASALRQWVLGARERLQALDLTRIGDSSIGQLLATASQAPDGQWPPAPVCDVIEEVASETLEENLRVGRLNLRGVTSRNLDSGGQQEHELVALYTQRAQTLEGRWPRTSSVLRALAQHYLAEAGSHDERAELTQDRWR